jgi:DNA-binding GntR family transcriptional regulator
VSGSKRSLQLDLSPDFSGYRTKADWAYLQLRRWIQSGALEAGQRLDQEQLAGRLGVSRVPLRQALVRLQADGLVIAHPHVGASVAPLSLAHAEDIYAARAALEPMLTAMAVPRMDDATIAELEALLDAQKNALSAEARALFLDLDRSFHTRLYEASGYRTSVELVQRLRDLSDRYVAAFQGNTRRSQGTLREHGEIIRACAQRDAGKAARLIEEHVRRSIEFLRGMQRAAVAETVRAVR